MEVLISVENFQDGGIVREINSPRTLEACLRAGLDPSDLFPKQRSAFDSKKMTKEMVDIKAKAFEQKRSEDKRLDRIALVKAERDAIIRYVDKQKGRTTMSPDKSSILKATKPETEGKDTMVEMEEKRMEALKRRQEKELEKIMEKEQTAAALQEKIKKAEEEEVHKKKLHEKKVAEQKSIEQKKQIQRQNDMKKQEEEEAKKKRDMDRKAAAFERKRQQAQAEAEKNALAEARAKDAERMEKMEQNRLKTEALIQAQFDIAEINRLKMIEREETVKRQIEEKKEKKRQEVQENRDRAAKRIAEAMDKFHELHEVKKKEYDERNRAAALRAKENEILEREKLKKQADDREKKNKQRVDRLVDAYRNRSEYRQSVIERRQEKDQVFDKVQEQRTKELQMMKFTSDLKFEDKMDNVERVSRVHEFQRLQSLRRIEEQEQRYAEIQAKKAELARKHVEEVKASLTRKHEIADAMSQMRMTNDFSLLDKLFAKKVKKVKKSGKPEEGEGGDERAHTA